MRRFIAFAGIECYPSGGWKDYAGDADTLDEAVTLACGRNQAYNNHPDWWHVIDTTTGATVAED